MVLGGGSHVKVQEVLAPTKKHGHTRNMFFYIHSTRSIIERQNTHAHHTTTLHKEDAPNVKKKSNKKRFRVPTLNTSECAAGTQLLCYQSPVCYGSISRSGVDAAVDEKKKSMTTIFDGRMHACTLSSRQSKLHDFLRPPPNEYI